jgi:hypothetical protein
MSNYELAALFQETVGNLHAVFGNFLTLLFAFLVTSYLVAARLSRVLSAIVLALFLLLASSQIMEIWLLNGDISGIARVINERVANGDNALAWHGTVVMASSERWITGLQVGSALGASVAAILFFFVRRRSSAENRR